MPFTIIRQDITKIKVDVVVNAVNTDLEMDSGGCREIFQAAGARERQDACDKIALIKTGQTVLTPGSRLSARYVIHMAGPMYRCQDEEQYRAFLSSLYRRALEIAKENGCESIAFPLISNGICGYPRDKTLEVARQSIGEFLQRHDMDIYLVISDKSSILIDKARMEGVERYIDRHYMDIRQIVAQQFFKVAGYVLEKALTGFGPAPPMAAFAPDPKLDALIKNLDEPFYDTLRKLIKKKGKTEVEVYKAANMDRKLFYKIRTVKGYTPKKSTILALAISLKLTLDETGTLLERAGYALSHASKFDVIVEYFIINEEYDIFKINEVLFYYDQPLLGS